MPTSGDRPRPGMDPAAPGAPASQADSLRLSHQGRPDVSWHNTNEASGPPAWAHRTVSCLTSPRGPGPGRERALTGSAGRAGRGRSPEAPAAARGVQLPSAGQHHLQVQHVIAHGAVAHRVGARGSGGRHAAERGVCTWVWRAEGSLGPTEGSC